MSGRKERKKEEEKVDNQEESNEKMPEAINIEEKTKISEESTQTDTNKQLEEIKEKLKKVEDQYLRILADYQNLQKRTAQEKEDLYKFASQKTIEALMPALDTFDYARSALKPDSEAGKIVQDFNLVFETLLKSLKEIGLEPIEETGVMFDPFYHEPLQQIYTNELPNHTVVQVLKKGYMLNGKVIRPALVSVSINPDDGKDKGTKELNKQEQMQTKEEKKHLGEG